MDIETRFSECQEKIASQLPQEDRLAMLKLYSLYKQSTVGDATGKRPGVTQPIKRIQWDAWKDLQGLPSSEAKKQYCEFVDKLLISQTT